MVSFLLDDNFNWIMTKEAKDALLILENEFKKFDQQRVEWELERTELKVKMFFNLKIRNK